MDGPLSLGPACRLYHLQLRQMPQARTRSSAGFILGCQRPFNLQLGLTTGIPDRDEAW